MRLCESNTRLHISDVDFSIHLELRRCNKTTKWLPYLAAMRAAALIKMKRAQFLSPLSDLGIVIALSMRRKKNRVLPPVFFVKEFWINIYLEAMTPLGVMSPLIEGILFSGNLSHFCEFERLLSECSAAVQNNICSIFFAAGRDEFISLQDNISGNRRD